MYWTSATVLDGGKVRQIVKKLYCTEIETSGKPFEIIEFCVNNYKLLFKAN